MEVKLTKLLVVSKPKPNILYGLGFRISYEADTYMTKITSNSAYIEDKTYTQTSSLVYAAVQYKF